MERLFTLILTFIIVSTALLQAQTFSPGEIANLQKQAKRITIVKDKWGVPHVYTKTDADAVFGMMYIQCEEFFEKVENTLITRLGRLAEVQGERELYQDLWARTFIDSTRALKLYQQTPKWLRKLCDAYAAGINFYMISHPAKKPKLITRVEPWMVLLNNIPSITGSNLTELEFRQFYSKDAGLSLSYVPEANHEFYQEAGGSNGWALAPSKTQSKKAMLLINPHSEFYGRIEIHLVSKQGLNSYGAPFLGQFNIFQGFNDFCGWMHPITLSDAKDLYAETVEKKDGKYSYRYNGEQRGIDSSRITVKYKKGNELLSKTFTIYRTHHGPVVAVRDKKWITLKSTDANIELLGLHWQKMKSKSFEEFQSTIGKRVMVGNNIIYADRKGNIAYWHGNYVPKRNPAYDWKRPVGGSTTVTEWQGTHDLSEIPHYINPANGWVQNCNSTPLYGAGAFDTLMSRKPSYMLPDGHTPRAMNAVRLLNNLKNATIDDVITATHDTYLPNAERFIPTLVKAFETNQTDSVSVQLFSPIQALRNWNFRADTTSVATTLGVMWVEKIIPLNVARLKKPIANEENYSVTNGANLTTDFITPKEQLALLAQVVQELKKDFGTWEVPWGSINRFQRIKEGETFSDSRPSWAVTATPGPLGSLNAYSSRKVPQAKAHYGVNGNTFVAVIEFGKTLKAKTILTGGASTDPTSPHFTDQVKGYINGQFKEIFFYKKDVMNNAERIYRPGE
ncbi:penicillin acylase family protein [Runella aurantiaca]|uniref:Penicillin acylase family protein n=1 Tax=Runella aurantiaca TaxID=2282308 RepID=A0A369I571_9BACT|nr:penicillin acylase family protein [Runella aurantiaca]RDB04931.1 penicillin acylase family protein [Runella aurantiaca]